MVNAICKIDAKVIKKWNIFLIKWTPII